MGTPATTTTKTVSGEVKLLGEDTKLNPLGYVPVLLQLNDGRLVSQLTDKDGKYEFKLEKGTTLNRLFFPRRHYIPNDNKNNPQTEFELLTAAEIDSDEMAPSNFAPVACYRLYSDNVSQQIIRIAQSVDQINGRFINDKGLAHLAEISRIAGEQNNKLETLDTNISAVKSSLENEVAINLKTGVPTFPTKAPVGDPVKPKVMELLNKALGRWKHAVETIEKANKSLFDPLSPPSPALEEFHPTMTQAEKQAKLEKFWYDKQLKSGTLTEENAPSLMQEVIERYDLFAKGIPLNIDGVRRAMLRLDPVIHKTVIKNLAELVEKLRGDLPPAL